MTEEGKGSHQISKSICKYSLRKLARIQIVSSEFFFFHLPRMSICVQQLLARVIQGEVQLCLTTKSLSRSFFIISTTHHSVFLRRQWLTSGRQHFARSKNFLRLMQGGGGKSSPSLYSFITLVYFLLISHKKRDENCDFWRKCIFLRG